jgi:hypothetical protein
MYKTAVIKYINGDAVVITVLIRCWLEFKVFVVYNAVGLKRNMSMEHWWNVTDRGN